MKSILIVDDDRHFLYSIEKALSKDYVILTASNGKEALYILEKLECIEMVITDNMMPRMNGIELIKNIRTTKRQVPVVLITSELDDELTNEALTYGAFHCFKKPLDLDALETVIRKIFQIESCQNPSI